MADSRIGVRLTEDIAHTSGDPGVQTLAVRNDTLAALAGTDGDYAPLQVNATGALYIQEGAALDVSGATVTVSGTVTANLSATDNTVLDNIDTDTSNIDTNTTDVPNVIGTDGTAGPTKCISIGGTESGGNLQELLVDSDGHLQIDVLSGGAGTEYTEDVSAPATPSGISIMMERDDALGGLTPIEGDWTHLWCDANGALWVHDDALDACISGSELQVDIVAGTVTTVTTVTTVSTVTNLAQMGGQAIAMGTGVRTAGTQRVTIATDDVVPASQSGTWTVDLGATDNAVLDNIDTDTTTIATNTTDLPNVIGTDGGAGPTKCLSIGGTESGGNLQEVLVDSDGHLQIDVLTGGGSETPTNPTIDVADADTPATIAPATPTNVDSPDLATKKLRQAIVASSVPFKVVLSTLSGGAATTFAVLFGGPGNNVIWNSPHKDYAVSGTTVAGFRARITNLDPEDTADFYVVWMYED